MGVVVGLILCLITVLLGCWILRKYMIAKLVCTSEMEAVITGCEVRKSRDDDSISTYYYYRYQYSYHGKLYDNITANGHQVSSPNYEVGEKVTLKYNPKNHTQNHIAGLGYSFSIFAGALLFIGLGSLFIYIIIRYGLCGE